MNNRKKEIIKMVKGIKDERYISFIYGAVRTIYREEQAITRIEDGKERYYT